MGNCLRIEILLLRATVNRELHGSNWQDRETADYLEATVYSKEEAVIMVGNFADVTTDEQRAKINHVTT